MDYKHEKVFSCVELYWEVLSSLGYISLMGEVGTWWKNVMTENKFQHGEVTWEEFLQHFCKRWLPKLYYDKKSIEFYKLVQENMIVA